MLQYELKAALFVKHDLCQNVVRKYLYKTVVIFIIYYFNIITFVFKKVLSVSKNAQMTSDKKCPLLVSEQES